jgi:hypothetical protein
MLPQLSTAGVHGHADYLTDNTRQQLPMSELNMAEIVAGHPENTVPAPSGLIPPVLDPKP